MSHEPYAYAYCAEIYCAPCGKKLPEIDPEGNLKHPIHSWELDDLAAEGLDSCCECGLISREWKPA
jgi:hypothetical protein